MVVASTTPLLPYRSPPRVPTVRLVVETLVKSPLALVILVMAFMFVEETLAEVNLVATSRLVVEAFVEDKVGNIP